LRPSAAERKGTWKKSTGSMGHKKGGQVPKEKKHTFKRGKKERREN
jgi:hypothetical protein